MATTPKMTREEFIKKYGTTFVADDKGGNAASEVAGQDVGSYYDMFLGPDARTTKTISTGWDGDTKEVPLDWGQGRYTNINPTFDSWDNVNPHPESQRGTGLEEAWRQVGRPIATAAAMYYGVNGLGGLMGSDTAAMGLNQVDAANPVASTLMEDAAGNIINTAGQSAFSGSGLIGPTASTIGSSVAPTLMEDAAGNIMNASGASAFSAPGGINAGGGITGALESAGKFLKDNPTLTQLGGAAIGALANSKDTTTGSTQSRDPWSQAQPYLIDNLKTNAAMQAHYAANPFSTEQKTAYQGLLNTLANNQANGAGLLANASSFGQSKGGKLPAMQGLLSGTQAAPIDWNQYSNIGRKA